MPTLFLQGDVLNTEGLRTFALAAPADGSMSQGVAVAFGKHFPGLADAYAAHCKSSSMQLGDVFSWTGDGCTVHVLATVPSADAKPKLAPFTRAIRIALERTVEAGADRIGTPRLGAGLDKVRVKRVLEEASADLDVTLMVFDRFVREKPAASEDS